MNRHVGTSTLARHRHGPCLLCDAWTREREQDVTSSERSSAIRHAHDGEDANRQR